MGCCMSPAPVPEVVNQMQKIESSEKTPPHKPVKPTAMPLPFKTKAEPQTSFESVARTPGKSSLDSQPLKDVHSSLENSLDDDDLPSTDLPEIQHTMSDFQIKMELRKSELLQEKARIQELQKNAFDQQVAAQQIGNYKRLYDVWEQYANCEDGMSMDVSGLTQAMKVFGMIIDHDREFQRHIFSKFDLDGKQIITYADFSATIASFVGSHTDDDALQGLFEIFDIEQKGYLDTEAMARILLAQNQIALVVTGQQTETTQAFTKKQCLKQAQRMIAEFDSEEFHDNKISFDEFKAMMEARTDHDMVIGHMKAPSISLNTSDRMSIDANFQNK